MYRFQVDLRAQAIHMAFGECDLSVCDESHAKVHLVYIHATHMHWPANNENYGFYK